jgi:hypothetical protein
VEIIEVWSNSWSYKAPPPMEGMVWWELAEKKIRGNGDCCCYFLIVGFEWCECRYKRAVCGFLDCERRETLGINCVSLLPLENRNWKGITYFVNGFAKELFSLRHGHQFNLLSKRRICTILKYLPIIELGNNINELTNQFDAVLVNASSVLPIILYSIIS